jgi:protein Tex
MDAALQAELGRIAQDMQLRRKQVESVFELMRDGCTTFQIARYRKLQTDALPEEAIRHIERQLRKYHQLLERRAAAIKLAEMKERATDAFREAIDAAPSIHRVDDLTASMRERRYGFADAAREKGLDAFAAAVWEQREEVGDLDASLAGLVDADKGLNSADDVVTHLAPLLAEKMMDHAEARSAGRHVVWQGRIASLSTTPSRPTSPPAEGSPPPDDRNRNRGGPANEFKAYANFSEPIGAIAANKLLALNRGERFGALRVRLEYDPKEFEHAVHEALDVATHKHAKLLEVAFPLALSHLATALEEEVRDEATRRAEENAAEVAARTVRNLLLQPGVGAERVLAIDPGLKNGCRYSVLDERGAILDFGVVFPFTARRKRKKKKRTALATEAAVEQKVAEWERSIAEAEGGAPPADHSTPTEATDRESAGEARHESEPRTPAPVLPADSFYRTTSESPEGDEDKTEEAPIAEVSSEVDAATATMEVSEPPIETEEGAPVAESESTMEGSAEEVEEVDHEDGDEESAARPPGSPPLPPRRDRAKALFTELLKKHGISKAAVGQGAGGREIEELLTEILKSGEHSFGYAVLHEGAALAYANGPAGREELPDLDPGLRTAVSLGRRLQDPLRELAKIDPQQFGLGTAHHEIGGRVLKDRLLDSVASVVNEIGVDVNECHPWLLQFVSGMNLVRARLVCDHRANNGSFKTREQLKQVEGMGEDTFNQAAGFVYVRGGDEPLDETRIHPESYPLARKILEKVGAEPAGLRNRDAWGAVAEKLDQLNAEALAKEFESDVPTVWDTLEYLARPFVDPRWEHPPIVLKHGLKQFEELKEGDELAGPILNIVEFGVFVDIGLKDCGLVHLSQMANRFVRTPHDVATVGDVVRVWVIGIDQERKRVSLTMLPPGARQRGGDRRPPRGGPRRGDQPGGMQQGEGRPPRQFDEGGGQGRFQDRGGPRVPGAQRTDQPRGDRGGGRRDGGGRPGDRRGGGGGGGGGERSREYTVRAKPKPTAELSPEALEGRGVLYGFGELKAFFEAKKPKSEPRQQDQPPTTPPPTDPEPAEPKGDPQAPPPTPDPGETG